MDFQSSGQARLDHVGVGTARFDGRRSDIVYKAVQCTTLYLSHLPIILSIDSSNTPEVISAVSQDLLVVLKTTAAMRSLQPFQGFSGNLYEIRLSDR
ncbi:hypothetical protein PsYK624_043600 [Phanerochaete sordida]|uniref:Uncharacterized protein n=1 Tax=Phanerochaete sordida TaxID=48140 RepID=A0A9P3G545_9APHY|nr:hypothetical protein PsYK624_043600 [Phanerochaete sordida]